MCGSVNSVTVFFSVKVMVKVNAFYVFQLQLDLIFFFQLLLIFQLVLQLTVQ